jgi:hypothetical protein
MPLLSFIPLFVFLPLLVLTCVLAANKRFSAAFEEKLELAGQRAGEAVMAGIWKLMQLDSAGNQQRVLFLHEVEMGTKQNFLALEGHTVRVSRKHARRIDDFILFNPLYGDNTAKVFLQHGYVLEVA